METTKEATGLDKKETQKFDIARLRSKSKWLVVPVDIPKNFIQPARVPCRKARVSW